LQQLYPFGNIEKKYSPCKLFVRFTTLLGLTRFFFCCIVLGVATLFFALVSALLGVVDFSVELDDVFCEIQNDGRGIADLNTAGDLI